MWMDNPLALYSIRLPSRGAVAPREKRRPSDRGFVQAGMLTDLASIHLVGVCENKRLP